MKKNRNVTHTKRKVCDRIRNIQTKYLQIFGVRLNPMFGKIYVFAYQVLV